MKVYEFSRGDKQFIFPSCSKESSAHGILGILLATLIGAHGISL